MKTKEQQLPTIAELFEGNLETAYKNEQLNTLLNQEPKKEWIKVHPYIKSHRYIPIDKIEFMLRKIFKRYRIEITGKETAFNGVVVTVRVYYWNPAINDFDYHDGIGGCELQLRAQTQEEKDTKTKVIFSIENINRGALSMAFPIAKTLAVKDACDHFGKLFGCDLNRKDVIPFSADKSLTEEYMGEPASDEQTAFIDELLHNTTLSVEAQEEIESQVAQGLSREGAIVIVNKLKENQKLNLNQQYKKIPA